MKLLKVLSIGAMIAIVGCAPKNQNIGVGKDGTVTAYEGFDRHSSIALFQSEKGRACYAMIKEALIVDLKNQPDTIKETNTRALTQYDAFVAQSNAMKELASDSMKYASHMVAYSNGLIPQDPIVQLAQLCKERGYYDWKTETQAERQKTYREISGDVKDLFLGTVPYAALAYLGARTGDTNTASGDGSAIGNENATAKPTVVEQPAPIIVDPVIVDPVIVDPVVVDPTVIPPPVTP